MPNFPKLRREIIMSPLVTEITSLQSAKLWAMGEYLDRTMRQVYAAQNQSFQLGEHYWEKRRRVKQNDKKIICDVAHIRMRWADDRLCRISSKCRFPPSNLAYFYPQRSWKAVSRTSWGLWKNRRCGFDCALSYPRRTIARTQNWDTALVVCRTLILNKTENSYFVERVS